MQRVHLLIGDALLERGLRRDRVGARRHETEPDRDAMDVGVDRKIRTVQGEEKDARRRLRSHAGERDERVPKILIGHGCERVLVERHTALADPPKHRANADGLRRSEAAAADRFSERGQRRVGDLVPDAEPPP